MSLNKTIEVLRRMPLFRRIDTSRLELIAMMGETLTVHGGERLAEQGDEGDAAFVIIEGAIEVMVSSGGPEVLVTTLGPGEIVGEMAVFADQPRSAAIVAAGEVVALRLERDKLIALLQEFPDFALEVIRILARRLAETTMRGA